MRNPVPWRSEKDLKTLVENRVIFGFENCELNIFETHQEAENVHLTFNSFVLTAMLKGKKNMALGNTSFFDYLPGEMVIVQPEEVMRINFPTATMEDPTQCIALSISEESIQETFEMMNEKYPRLMSGNKWELDKSFFHLLGREDLNKIVNRFINLAISDNSGEKDVIAKFTLKEMLIRLSQTQARHLLEATLNSKKDSNPLFHVVNYIKTNITEKFSLNGLSKMACLSPTHFSRLFKLETGMTLTEFIQYERLKKAKKLLIASDFSVREIAFRSGFTDVNFFNRVFKRELGITPTDFRVSR